MVSLGPLRAGVFGGCDALLSLSLCRLVDEEEEVVGRASRASLYRVLRCTQFMIGDRFEGESVAGGGVLGGLTSASSKPATTSSVWMSASNRISLISKQKGGL